MIARAALFSACLFAACLAGQAAPAEGLLRVGRVEPPPGLGVPFGSIGQPSSNFWSAMFDGLTRTDSKGNLLPALALSWSNDGANTWTFKIRGDAAFHNGVPVTAETVAAALDVLKSGTAKTAYVASELAGVDTIKAADAGTLVIMTHQPDPVLANRLAILMVVEPGAWSALGSEKFSRAPVGTGPFQFVSSVGASTRLKASNSSWRAPSDVAELEFVAIPEITARLPALQSGRIDVAEALTADDIAAAASEGLLREVAEPAHSVLAMMFRNVGDKDNPLNDVRVRRAINHAIDKAAIAREILGGRMSVATQGVPSGMIGFDSAIAPVVFDPALARRLLTEAVPAGGVKLKLDIVGATPFETTMYQKIAQDLAVVGIAVDVGMNPFPAFLNKLASGNWGNTDMFPLIWDASVYGDPSRIMRISSCLKPAPFFCDPAVSPALDAVAGEMDADRRRAGLQRAMAATHAAVPGVWLLEFRRLYAVGPRVKELPLIPSGIAYDRVVLKDE